MKWMLFAAAVAVFNSVALAQEAVASEVVQPVAPIVEDEAPFQIVIEDVPETEEEKPAPEARPVQPAPAPAAGSNAA